MVELPYIFGLPSLAVLSTGRTTSAISSDREAVCPRSGPVEGARVCIGCQGRPERARPSPAELSPDTVAAPKRRGPAATIAVASAGGGIGRRARLRALWAVGPWRVKSSPAHFACGGNRLPPPTRLTTSGFGATFLVRTNVRIQGEAESMLTQRQREIWEFIVEYVDGHGYPPTVREIGEAVGLASPSTVHAHLANLERAGLLRRDPTKPRALELVAHRQPDRPAVVAREARGLPLVGQIAD